MCVTLGKVDLRKTGNRGLHGVPGQFEESPNSIEQDAG
jgi:hypothetical protein